jgi:Tfp pilus assembly protein PilV
MRAQRQRGAGLLEALIAFLVLSMGMVGMVRLQSHLRLDADIARQSAEAVRLAQQDIEGLRAYSDPSAYAGIATAVQRFDLASGFVSNTSFELTRRIVEVPGSGYKAASLTVTWPDRTGAAQRVELEALIVGSDPLHGASLAVARRPDAVRGAAGRSPRIPVLAKDLGDGRSVLKPSVAGSLAFVFDNASGQIIARCNAIASAKTTADLLAGDVANCDPANAFVLSGVVRFSLARPPDPARADDAPLPLAIALTLTGGTYPAAPECGADIQSFASGERLVAYHCMVTPLNGRWSGSSSVVPQGWSLGIDALQYRVCRYSADQDGSGQIDANVEHPKDYSQVEGALMQQNFLVIRGDQACPLAPAVGGTLFSNLGTLPHQP